MAAVCTLIATSAHEGLELYQWDVQAVHSAPQMLILRSTCRLPQAILFRQDNASACVSRSTDFNKVQLSFLRTWNDGCLLMVSDQLALTELCFDLIAELKS
eukprot:3832249-Rhodomonas_salina.1